MKTLDLQNLSVEQTVRLNEIARDHRKPYTEFVDDLSIKKKRKFAWWVTGFSTRNSEYSQEKLYKFLLFKEIISTDLEINKVLIDDIGLYRIVRKYIKIKKLKGLKVIRKEKNIKYMLPVRLIAFVYLWIRKIKEYIVIRNSDMNLPEKNLKIEVLIDTYVLDSCFDKDGKYIDRYFNGILKYISRNVLFSTVLVPNIVEPFSRFVDKLTLERNYNFIVKEKILKFSDYIRMLYFPIYCLRLLTEHYYYGEDDITSIIRRDLVFNIANNNTLDGYIAYAFIKRLKERNTKIENVVLWYEGQPSTIGFTIGMRKFYPEVQVKNFLELSLMENSLSLFPSKGQIHQKIVPNCIGVMGQALIDDIKVFCDELNVEVYPAFRYYSDLSEKEQREYHKGKKILVVLPGSQKISKILLDDVIKALLNDVNVRYHVYIKNHPNNERFSLNDYKCKFDVPVKFVNGKLTDLLSDVDIAINAMSSSGMEIIAKGVYLITYVPCGTLSNLGIPKNIPKSVYKIAYCSEDIWKGILQSEYWENSEKLQDITYYFEPVTRESVIRMVE